jgi:hypothetical protein
MNSGEFGLAYVKENPSCAAFIPGERRNAPTSALERYSRAKNREKGNRAGCGRVNGYERAYARLRLQQRERRSARAALAIPAVVLPVEHHRMTDHARRTTGPGRVGVAETRQSAVCAGAFNLHLHLGTGFRGLTGHRR